MIKHLAERANEITNELMLSPEYNLQLIISLNIIGDKSDKISKLLTQLENTVNDYTDDELYLIDRMIAMEDQINFKYEKLRALI